MRSSLFLSLLIAIFLAAGAAEAQMMLRPGSDYLSVTGKKKKEKTPAKPAEKKTEGSAENEIRAGLGFFTGFPVSVFNENNYTGYGINLDGEYFLMPALSVGLNTGYHGYKYDEIHIGIGRFSLIPIQLRGAWYFLDGDFHPYAGLNAGIFLTRSKYDSIIEPRSYLDPVTQIFVHKPGAIKPIDEKSNHFGVAPMIGIVYKMSDKLWLNCNTRYNILFTDEKNFSFIGLHIGLLYSFGI